MIKNYVLDTNLLLDNPNAIFGFKDNNIYITGTTLQELDNHKKDRGERGYNARECGRILTELSDEYGNLTKGVPLPNGGKLFIIAHGVDESFLPKGFSISVPDNRIISACKYLSDKNGKDKVILLSNDTYMRINASACGVRVQSVRNDRIEDSNYTGHRIIELYNAEIIEKLYDEQTIDAKYVLEQMRDNEMALTENEFLTLQCEEQTALTVYRENKIELISSFKNKHIFGKIKPKNSMQSYALWALTNPDIDLVILKGPAGTAKTFLSLAAGLTQSYSRERMIDVNANTLYKQIMISRPNVEGSDPGFGFLPGSLNDKMAPLLASYSDNLDILCKREKVESNNLLISGIIDICPLNYIRGRSLKDRYLICDEAQNANAQLIKAVVTRAGTGTKIIIAGDPDQCDAPRLDKFTNGLVYAAETMKGAPNTAILRFDKEQCERSNLAKIAIERMK